MKRRLGRVIRDARNARRWTLREVASRVSVHELHLGGVETGRVKAGPKLCVRLARVLDVDPRLLLKLALVEKAHVLIREELRRALF